MGEFSGRIAVITGGAQGLGLAIARLLYERGASVALLDVDRERLNSSKEFFSDPDRLLTVVTDVTDELSLQQARDEISTNWGPANVLINNAGIYPHARLSEMSVDEWDHVFNVNAKSMWLATRTFMAGMVAQQYGRIVSIVTVDAYIAKPTTAHYAASKASLLSLTKTYAIELAPSQVLVNGVSPGAIATERAKSQSWLKERIKEIPVGRAAEPEDIAEVVAFLASDRNRFVTGEVVVASGGTVML